MTLTSEEALRVARFCWPEQAWGSRVVGDPKFTPDSIAAAERVLVERGLGEAYGRALRLALRIKDAEKDYYGQYLTDGEIAAIRTAPTEVIARAVLRVVDEQLSKETR